MLEVAKETVGQAEQRKNCTETHSLPSSRTVDLFSQTIALRVIHEANELEVIHVTNSLSSARASEQRRPTDEKSGGEQREQG